MIEIRTFCVYFGTSKVLLAGFYPPSSTRVAGWWRSWRVGTSVVTLAATRLQTSSDVGLWYSTKRQWFFKVPLGGRHRRGGNQIEAGCDAMAPNFSVLKYIKRIEIRTFCVYFGTSNVLLAGLYQPSSTRVAGWWRPWRVGTSVVTLAAMRVVLI